MNYFNVNDIGGWPVFVLVVAWSLFWKGLALWHAAKRGQIKWFLVMLILNTLGILEIIYLFAVVKIKFGKPKDMLQW
ncbi:MAG: DUF5652 family protein [Patescibacteria group bacterium]